MSSKLYLLFLSIFFTCLYNTHAQKDIIQIKSDCVISAEASNLFPRIGEVVNIRVKFKSPLRLTPGETTASFIIEDGVNLVSGNKVYNGNAEKDEIITMEINVNFREPKTYFIMLDFSTFHVNRLANFKFYVDCAFKESVEVQSLRKDIKEQKEIIEKAISNSNMELDDYLVASFADTVKDIHTIYPDNPYEEKNLSTLLIKNRKLFKYLKNDFDSLRNVAKVYKNKKKALIDNSANKTKKENWTKNHK